jgi:hypothetical protein
MPASTLFSCLAGDLIGSITKKKLFAGEYVELGQLLMASQYLFETGVMAAHIFTTKLDVLLKLCAKPGEEERCLGFLQDSARERLAAAGEDWKNFADLFLFTEMRKAGLPNDWIGSDLARVSKAKVSVNNALLRMQLYGAEGIGFACMFPKLSAELLEESFKPLDPVEWNKWRSSGLDVPNKPPSATLNQQKEMIRGLVAGYVSRFRPELKGSLGVDS